MGACTMRRWAGSRWLLLGFMCIVVSLVVPAMGTTGVRWRPEIVIGYPLSFNPVLLPNACLLQKFSNPSLSFFAVLAVEARHFQRDVRARHRLDNQVAGAVRCGEGDGRSRSRRGSDGGCEFPRYRQRAQQGDRWSDPVDHAGSAR